MKPLPYYFPPDGGWGWTIVAGAAFINIFNQSLLSLFGLLFGPRLEEMAGVTGVTTVMSVNCTISNFSGFLISPLSKYITTKQITQLGVLLVALGVGISAYTDTYWHIIFGYGFCSGVGLGLISASTFLIINSYFCKNKSLAVGFAMAGTSIGQMCMPPIVASLVGLFGYPGTTLIMAGLCLHGLIGSMFFDPVSQHMVIRRISPNNNTNNTKGFWQILCHWICCLSNSTEQVEKNSETNSTQQNANNEEAGATRGNIDDFILHGADLDNETNKTNGDAIIICNKYAVQGEDSGTSVRVRTPVENDTYEEETAEESTGEVESDHRNDDDMEIVVISDEVVSEEVKTPSNWQRFVDYFDMQLLLDPVFAHIMVGLSLGYTTSITFSTLFPLFLEDDMEMSLLQTSTCMATLSLLDFFSRILVPIISSQCTISHRITYIIGSIALALSRSVLVLQTSYQMVLAMSAVCGLARAATVINQNLVIAEYTKDVHVSSAVGLNMVSKGIFVLTVGRLLAIYKDSAHNYAACIHVLNVISIVVVISWCLELAIKKILQKRHQH